MSWGEVGGGWSIKTWENQEHFTGIKEDKGIRELEQSQKEEVSGQRGQESREMKEKSGIYSTATMCQALQTHLLNPPNTTPDGQERRKGIEPGKEGWEAGEPCQALSIRQVFSLHPLISTASCMKKLRLMVSPARVIQDVAGTHLEPTLA